MDIETYARCWFPVSLVFMVITTALLILATVFLTVLNRQLRTLTKLQTLHADLTLFTEISKSQDIPLERTLYAKFCENDFSLNLEDTPEALRVYMVTLIGGFNRIGGLLQTATITATSPSVRNLFDDCLRLWFILEGYIHRARRKRGDPSWAISMQYFTVLSLRSRLKNPQAQLTIYHPHDQSRGKTYSRRQLLTKLHELEKELVRFETLPPPP